jgi:hypothetical protein
LRSSTIFLCLLVIISLVLAGKSFVFVSSVPKYYGGAGGTISGTVVGPSGYVVDWTQISAISGNQTFKAFSGFSGLYLMRVPAGTYNVSVYDPYSPQYWAPNANVTVTDGSSSTVNFYLRQQPPSAIPEFQPNLSVFVVVLVLAAICFASRRLKH